MKKALFATTALVAFAGAAAAEVTISGSAEMGLIGGDRFLTTTTGGPTGATTIIPLGTQYWNDVDIKFTLSGESDAGISFGAVVDTDESVNLQAEEDNQGTSVFISGDFGTLTLGDTDGALDWALTDAGDIGNPGSIADDETSHAGYDGDRTDGFFDDQVLRYDYSFGDFGVAVSYEQGATLPAGLVPDPTVADGTIALGVKYALDLGGATVNLGAGYSSTDLGAGADVDVWGISVDGSFGGGFVAGIDYWDGDTPAGGVTHTGIGIGYESGPISVHANWGEFDPDGLPSTSGFGVAAAYDFGGGLSANIGYGSSDVGGGAANIDTWSLGMVMSF
jgi:outer membrane protein OmpU